MRLFKKDKQIVNIRNAHELKVLNLFGFAELKVQNLLYIIIS